MLRKYASYIFSASEADSKMDVGVDTILVNSKTFSPLSLPPTSLPTPPAGINSESLAQRCCTVRLYTYA